MPGLIPESSTCCDPCQSPVSVAVPGPQGPAGADGTDGTDGVNAFTTASLFVMPAELANVVVTVADSTWMTVGQIVFAAAGGAVGHFEVIAKPTALSVTLKNLEDTASSAYTGNSAPATNFPNGTSISPAGLQGPIGTTPAGVLLAANNLNDVANAATSRTNLGLGSLATLNTVNDGNWSGTDLAVANGGTGSSTAAGARTNLGAAASGLATASGLTVSTGERILGKASGAPAGAVEEIICTSFAQTLLDDANAAAARTTLGVSAAGAYAFSATQTAGQGFANTTLTQVEFGATEFDDDGVWNTTDDEYTADVNGLYFFMGQVVWTGFAGAVEMLIQIQKNGTVVAEYVLDVESNAAGEAGIQISTFLSLAAADVITLWASQTSGSGETTDNDAARTFFKGWAVSV